MRSAFAASCPPQSGSCGWLGPSLAANYFPEDTRVDAQLEHRNLLAFNCVDLNLLGVIHEGLCDCLY